MSAPAQRKCAGCEWQPGGDAGGQKKKKLRACSRCKRVWYCSRECQKTNWRTHRKVCKAASKPAAPSAAAQGAGVAESKVQEDTSVSAGDMSVSEFFEDSCVPVTLVQAPSTPETKATSGGLGRHVVAKANLPPGTMVLAADRYASVVAHEVAVGARHCHTCFEASTSLQRCSGCRYAVYCDRECAAAAAPTHVHECAALKRLVATEVAFDGDKEFAAFLASGPGLAGSHNSSQDQLLSDDALDVWCEPSKESEGSRPRGQGADTSAHIDKETLRLALAILARRHQEPPAEKATGAAKASRGVRHPWCFEDVRELEGHVGEVQRDPSRWNPVKSGAKFLLRMLEGTPLAGCMTVDELCALFLRLKFNCHPIMDDSSLQRVGVGLYPAACYLNHDCTPNAVAHTVNGGSIIVFRAIRPIPKGEPVTYAYIDLYQTTSARQRLLKAGYLFDCHVRTVEIRLVVACSFPSYSFRNQCGRCTGATAVEAERQLSALACPSCDDGILVSQSDRSMKCTTCGTSKSESATKDTYRAFLSAYRRAIVLLKHDAAGGHKLLQELAHSDVAKSLHPNHVLTLGLHLALVVSASQMDDGVAKIQHSGAALACIRSVTPTAVQQLCTLATMRAAAMVKVLHGGGGGRSSGHVVSRAAAMQAVGNARNVLALTFGETHPRTQHANQLFKVLAEGKGHASAPRTLPRRS